MKTPIQTLIDRMYSGEFSPLISRALITEELRKLLPKEREQIERAFDDGFNECDLGNTLGSAFKSPSDYYTQTFEQ